MSSSVDSGNALKAVQQKKRHVILNKLKVAELQSKVPRVLWKYCGSQATPLLKNMQLKVTRPNEFNDPFEFRAAMVGTIKPTDIERYYSDPAWVAHWNPPPLPEDNDERQYSMVYGAKIMTEAGQEIIANELDRISSKYAVICLSADPNSILMRSHYAQNHQGFNVGIEHRKLGEIPLFPVHYSERRVTFNSKTPLKIFPEIRALDIFRRKSALWSYEKEYRSIWPLTELLRGNIGSSEAYFLPLVPEAIVEVRLGCRCSPELEADIRDILLKHHCKALVRRAKLHSHSYRLLFDNK